MNRQLRCLGYVSLLALALSSTQIFAAEVCWKATYGRGVGEIPARCDPTGLVKSGLLCYEKPKQPGWFVVAGIAQPGCPSGFRDDGLFCFKPVSYGRGAGYPIWDKGRCENDQSKDSPPTCEPGPAGHWISKCNSGDTLLTTNGGCAPTSCPPGTEKDQVYPSLCKKITGEKCPLGFDEYSNNNGKYCRFGFYLRKSFGPNEKEKCENANRIERCEQSGALHYPKCKTGFHAVGCCVCSPDCPAGMSDAGISCAKPTYVTGPITPSCESSQQYDAGLCYKKCDKGFYGIGPVCWGECPKGMVDCGAMCGASVEACLASVGDMVMAAVSAISKIVGLVGSLGISEAVNMPANAAKESLILGLKETAKKIAKDIAKKFAGLAKTAIAGKIAGELKTVPNMPPALANKLGSMAADPDDFDYKGFLASLDPTGLATLAMSFVKPICEVSKDDIAVANRGAASSAPAAAPPVKAAPAVAPPAAAPPVPTCDVQKGQMVCGNSCCSVNQNCKNGQCVKDTSTACGLSDLAKFEETPCGKGCCPLNHLCQKERCLPPEDDIVKNACLDCAKNAKGYDLLDSCMYTKYGFKKQKKEGFNPQTGLPDVCPSLPWSCRVQAGKIHCN